MDVVVVVWDGGVIVGCGKKGWGKVKIWFDDSDDGEGYDGVVLCLLVEVGSKVYVFIVWLWWFVLLMFIVCWWFFW